MLGPIENLEQYQRDHGTYGIIGRSQGMLNLFRTILSIAHTNVPVLIIGESGAGKEKVARAIHHESKREPFVALNCGALTESLLESELYGHVRGAFTGAHIDKKGYFETASAGTIFLDEVTEMSRHMQVGLLRVLQEHEFYRVGDPKKITTNARVIAAASDSLDNAVAERTFIIPLYHRLSVIPIRIPPLSARGEDILLLARYFCQMYCNEHNMSPLRIDDGAYAFLQYRHNWPGNVRELQSLMERIILLGHDEIQARGQVGGVGTIQQSDIQKYVVGFSDGDGSTAEQISQKSPTLATTRKSSYQMAVDNFSRSLILSALEEAKGNRRQAASLLGIKRHAFYKKLKSLGINIKSLS